MGTIKELTIKQIHSAFESLKEKTCSIKGAKNKVRCLLCFIDENKNVYEQENRNNRPAILPTKCDTEFKNNIDATVAINILTAYMNGENISYNKNSNSGKLVDEIICYYEHEETLN